MRATAPALPGKVPGIRDQLPLSETFTTAPTRSQDLAHEQPGGEVAGEPWGSQTSPPRDSSGSRQGHSSSGPGRATWSEEGLTQRDVPTGGHQWTQHVKPWGRAERRGSWPRQLKECY